MPNPTDPQDLRPEENATASAADETTESFADALQQYERETKRKKDAGERQIEATIVSITADAVLLDIGYKSEGSLPLTAFGPNESPKIGDKMRVTVKGRNPEGYYELSRFKERRVIDWDSLEKAFNEKATIGATVTAVVKGGLSVDVGVRGFMPASRTGTRDATEMEKLVGQEIRCRITKLDIADEDVVVDRRVVLEEEERAKAEQLYSEMKEGAVVRGTVRSLTEYGAFVDIGGIDGLLHVGDMSWTRVANPSDVVSVGDELEVRILKIEPEKRRISLGLKQLQEHPWEQVPSKFAVGQRVRGTVTRIVDFGAFVELEPGIEGLIHISEMSWAKRVKKASDIVSVGDNVEVVVLGINPDDRRIALGLKQALGDPWADLAKKYSAGSVVEGTVTSLTKFGAFVQLAEGVEGMIHVSEISAEKRIAHPQDVLKVGEHVRAQVLAIDGERRLMKLSMKQLVPTSLDEFIAENKVGDKVTGRVVNIDGDQARIELGEGIVATCKVKSAAASEAQASASGAKADLSSLSAMLNAKWKGGAGASTQNQEALSAGQIRGFKLTKLDAEAKRIEVEQE